jgi:hypothetical protein
MGKGSEEETEGREGRRVTETVSKTDGEKGTGR